MVFISLVITDFVKYTLKCHMWYLCLDVSAYFYLYILSLYYGNFKPIKKYRIV